MQVCCQRQVVFWEILTDVNHRTWKVIIHMRFRKHDPGRRVFAQSMKNKVQVDITVIFQYTTDFN